MDSEKEKISNKEDSDSGVDNTSDSGHSGDEELLAIPSDDEDILNSDNEENFLEEESSIHPKLYMNDPDNINIRKILCKNIEDLDVQIELNSDVVEEYKDVIEFYEGLTKGQCETVDFRITSDISKPEWLDEEKFKRGQKFARDHLFCINFAEMLSLFILFAQKSSLGPLIFTGKSDSPFTSFTRYLNTLTKLISWYKDDVWNERDNEGNKNLSIVRGMHKNVYQNLTRSTCKDLTEKTTLGDPNTTALWCPMHNALMDDFRESLPPLHPVLEHLLDCKKVWVNQADMSMTQFGFVGLAVTYPEYFGIHLASPEDLDAFLHLWRGLGFLLGIKDEYNYCNGDLETVRRRTKFFLEAIAKPSFRDVTWDWEHMCRCLTAGISFYLPLVNFDSAFLYLCDVLNIDTPRLRKRMSFKSYLGYLLHRFVFYFMKYPSILRFLNSRLYLVIKKVQNIPPEVLTKWQNKEFSYMKQEGKCPIRGQLVAR